MEDNYINKEASEIMKAIDGLYIDYRNTDLQIEYQKLRNNIDLDRYFDYHREKKNSQGYFSGLFHFALNVRVLPEGSFIPFMYIKHTNQNKTNEIYDWAAKSFQTGKIKYNFSDFLQDEVLQPTMKRYPQSDLFFRTKYHQEAGRYLIDELNVLPQGVSRGNEVPIEADQVNSINQRLKTLDGPDFIQQLSELYYKKDDEDKYYYLENPNGDLFFGLYSFDSDYKTNTKLTSILIIGESKEEVKSFVEYHIRQIRDLASLFRIRFTRDILRKQEIEATKSAKSAIMSRNMSHNLGSHFISNTKNYFNALIDIDCEHEAVYRGIKYSLQYIQERMDFIATVTSDDMYPFGAVNAKAQIFDELTPDDLGVRHKKLSLNFLMDFLVLSEKISKRSYLNLKCEGIRHLDKPLLSEGKYVLKLKMGYQDEKGIVTFWDSSETTEDQNLRRDDLVNINFAIPGGVLGRHALFSIIENIIRNAAKHGQDKIETDFTVKMLCTNDEHFIIYDNKFDSDIQRTVQNLRARLNTLTMLNPDNTLNQDNKGLKEILICAVWLQNADFNKVLYSRQFDDYVQILAVDENGQELAENVPGFLAYKIKLNRYKKVVHLNEEFIIEKEIDALPFDKLKEIKADIICANKNYKVGDSSLKEIFPRFVEITLDEYNKKKEELKEDKFAVYLLRTIVEKNCHIRTNDIQMVLSTDKKKEYEQVESHPIIFYDDYHEKSNNDFLFKGHAGKSKWSKFYTLFLTKGFENKYIDSISGGDFTHTIVQPSFTADDYNLLKIYESVKTRFVIIDERVFEQFRSNLTPEDRKTMLSTVRTIKQNIETGSKTIDNVISYLFFNSRGPRLLGQCDITREDEDPLKKFLSDDTKLYSFLEKDIEQHYLERRDIHIFSFDSNQNDYILNDLSGKGYGQFVFSGEKLEFHASSEKTQYFVNEDDAPITFLSIHLGLIDKVKDNLGVVNDHNFNEALIVEALQKYFNAKFVSIHSGRGGFDVRNNLKKYVFQSYSAVENPLHNSKYLLAQQFYNLNYYGGGK